MIDTGGKHEQVAGCHGDSNPRRRCTGLVEVVFRADVKEPGSFEHESNLFVFVHVFFEKRRELGFVSVAKAWAGNVDDVALRRVRRFDVRQVGAGGVDE